MTPTARLAAAPRRVEPIGIFCKSFVEDFPRLRLLLQTLRACNAEAIPFVLSLPGADIPAFSAAFGLVDFPVLADEDLTGLPQRAGQGWTYQQVVKLCADRSGVAEAVFVVDSDFVFIRPFHRAEFLDHDGTPATFLSPHGHTSHTTSLAQVVAWVDGGPAASFSDASVAVLRSGRAPALSDAPDRPATGIAGNDLSRLFGRPYETYWCMPGPVLQAAVLRGLRAQPPWKPGQPPGTVPYLLIDVAPWEYVWHAEYLFVSDRALRIRPPVTFHVHSEDGLAQTRQLGLTETRLARRYCAVAMAARHVEAMRIETGAFPA